MLSALVPLAALGVAALAYARLRTGAQGTLLLLIAALATVAGADDGAAHIAVDRLGGGEDLNPLYRRAARGAASVWLVPGAGHTGALSARPREYERRVTAFFDRALLGARQAVRPDAAPAQPAPVASSGA